MEDILYDFVAQMAIKDGKASLANLQRELGIGYARARRLIDCMIDEGVISCISLKRRVVHTPPSWALRQVAEFNSGCPVGSEVLYYSMLPPTRPPVHTRVRHEAVVSSAGDAVVSLESRAGYVAVTHVKCALMAI